MLSYMITFVNEIEVLISQPFFVESDVVLTYPANSGSVFLKLAALSLTVPVKSPIIIIAQ